MKRSITSTDKRLYSLLAVVFWLLVWQCASMAMGELFLASPVAVLKTLAAQIGKSAFWHTIAFSLMRITTGFSLAFVLGISLASASARIPVVRELLHPIVSIIQATPVASFIILALLWFGSHNISLVISFLMVFPILYTSTLSGIDAIDCKLLEMAQVFDITLSRRIFYIYLPGVMPFFLSGCRIGLGLCWKSGIAAEVIGWPAGSIGEQLYQAKLYLQSSDLFAWTAVIIAISALFERVVLWLLRRFEHFVKDGGAL
ncbi:MAG: ABC transporter permease subunit [Oscillospiraceae bacterium]